MNRGRSRRARILQSCMLIWLVAVQCFAVAVAPELPDPGKPKMTRDKQRQMGLQVAAEVYKQMPVLPDSSPETKYVQALGKRLVDTIPAQTSWPFEFHVIPQKEINAFALPGGPMFVNVGTITAAKNEAELAGVMAHEIAHVYMQHSAKQQDKGSLIQGLAGIASAAAGGLLGGWGGLAQMGIQMGAGTLMLKYSRGDESEADAVGAIILWKAGINPVALADFFQTMAGEGGSGGPQFLQSHPNPGNRKTAIETKIKDWPPKEYSAGSAQFASVQEHARTLRTYTAKEIEAGAKNGQWTAENNKNGAVFRPASLGPGTPGAKATPAPRPAAPSRQLVSFSNDLLELQHPNNWKPGGQGSAFSLAPEGGVVPDSSGQAGLAYGIMSNVYKPQRTTNTSPTLESATEQLVIMLRQGNPNLQIKDQASHVKVGGNDGISVLLTNDSPLGGLENAWLVTTYRPAGLVYFIGIAPEQEFQAYAPHFQRILASMKFRH